MYKKKDYALLFFGVIIVSIFPVLFLWLNNIIQVQDIGNVLKMIGMIVLAAAVLCIIFYFCYRRHLFAAGLAAIVTIIVFENELYLEKLMQLVLPGMRYWHGIAVIILLLAGLFYLLTKLNEESGKQFVKIVSLVFTLLTLFNLVMAVPAILAKIRMDAPGSGDANQAGASDTALGRNVYWLLFDDYAPNVSMMEYYGYDNSAFTDWLEEQGFSVSYTSRNETYKTPVITCNITNLGYVASYSDERTLSEDYALVTEQRKSSKVLSTIEQNGYNILAIGYANYYGYTGETVGQTNIGATVDGKTIVTLFLEKTAAYPFVTVTNNSEVDAMLAQLQYLQNPQNIPAGGTFVLSHICCPHAPMLFFADGSPATPLNPSNYLEQYKFVTTQMRKMIEVILENDPTAMIAVMSDHGNKAKGDYEQKSRCFAALYNGAGRKIDIEGYTGINTMVVMLNEVYGTDYPYVPYELQEDVITH